MGSCTVGSLVDKLFDEEESVDECACDVTFFCAKAPTSESDTAPSEVEGVVKKKSGVGEALGCGCLPIDEKEGVVSRGGGGGEWPT